LRKTFIVAIGLSALLLSCGGGRQRGSDDDVMGDDDDGGSGVNPTCATSTSKAGRVNLDMMIMLDRSGSMQGASWDGVTEALKAFVNQPGLDGVSVGLNYFGQPPSAASMCTKASCSATDPCQAGCGPCFILPGQATGVCPGILGNLGGDSCNAVDYSGAAVGIEPIATAAARVVTSIDGQPTPNTGTPTFPALQGAITYAHDWGKTHAGDAMVVVLATDGNPESCDTDTGHISQVAASGFMGTPKVTTFAIGVGAGLNVLNAIAQAGGSGTAITVDTGGNVNQQFLDAMNAIRNGALGCVYSIPVPDDGIPDYNSVNVTYTPSGGGQPAVLPRVDTKAQCPSSGNAWYYDNITAPTQILLCDSTCSVVEADASGEVDVTLGCATVIE